MEKLVAVAVGVGGVGRGEILGGRERDWKLETVSLNFSLIMEDF